MGKGFYKFIRDVLTLYFSVAHPIRVVNPENIPTEGPTVVCANHISLRDPMLVAMTMKTPVRFMAKKELFDNKLLKPIVEALGAFPVDRGNADASALRTSVAVLKQGDIMGIFPEGTRYLDGQYHPIQSGVASIALRGKAKVVPVFIEGPYRPFRPIRVHYGKALDYTGFEGRVDRAAIDSATEAISNGIWSLRPSLPDGKN